MGCTQRLTASRKPQATTRKGYANRISRPILWTKSNSHQFKTMDEPLFVGIYRGIESFYGFSGDAGRHAGIFPPTSSCCSAGKPYPEVSTPDQEWRLERGNQPAGFEDPFDPFDPFDLCWALPAPQIHSQQEDRPGPTLSSQEQAIWLCLKRTPSKCRLFLLVSKPTSTRKGFPQNEQAGIRGERGNLGGFPWRHFPHQT